MPGRSFSSPAYRYGFNGKENDNEVNGTKNQPRFCDLMSSHMMRRTAITNMLTLGMPEILVKHISGHAGDSKSFHRYVSYSRSYMNAELDKVYDKMEGQF